MQNSRSCNAITHGQLTFKRRESSNETHKKTTQTQTIERNENRGMMMKIRFKPAGDGSNVLCFAGGCLLQSIAWVLIFGWPHT